MVLQIDKARLGAFFKRRCRGPFGQIEFIVNDNAVVPDGHPRILYLFTILEYGGMELYVVGLPSKRGETHVFTGRGNSIHSPAFIVFAFQTKEIQFT